MDTVIPESNNANLAIAVEQVSKVVLTAASSLTILQNINLEIESASSVAIVGVSGSGKSTLLGLLAGLDLPSEGRISIHQHKISDMDEDQRAWVRGELVGFVFQSFHLLPSLTALENVMLPLELKNDPQAKALSSRLLERVNLAHRLHHYPNQLSGGEQQRVALARAFVNKPKILFADEPTGNLDSATSATIEKLLFELNTEHGTTLVLVTHDSQLAGQCQKRILLEAGKITSIQPG